MFSDARSRCAALETQMLSLLNLLYALEVYNLDRKTMHSLDFTLNRFFVKLFKPSSLEVVRRCHSVFGYELPT